MCPDQIVDLGRMADLDQIADLERIVDSVQNRCHHPGKLC